MDKRPYKKIKTGVIYFKMDLTKDIDHNQRLKSMKQTVEIHENLKNVDVNAIFTNIDTGIAGIERKTLEDAVSYCNENKVYRIAIVDEAIAKEEKVTRNSEVLLGVNRITLEKNFYFPKTFWALSYNSEPSIK